MRVRPFSRIPKPALLLLSLGLCAQLYWHTAHPDHAPQAENLPVPASLPTLRLAGLGEPDALARLLLLYLQSFDDQPGVTAAFQKLDYTRMTNWLDISLALEPRSQYPLFLASRIYGSVGDTVKKSQMFEFVYRKFFDDPNRRWESLAYAAVMTRHQLNDLPTAHRYASALFEHTTAAQVPDWVRQMDIFMLEDMQQYQPALTLLDRLLQSGQVTNPEALHFLNERRQQLVTEAAQ